MAIQDADAQRGIWTDPNLGRESFAAIAAEWQASRQRTGPKTRAGHDSILLKHLMPEFGQRRLASIDAADIQKWVNRLAASRAPNTVHNCFAVLRLVMDFAVRRRFIAVNPCLSVERPSKRRRVRITALTHAQVRALAGNMPTERDRLAVLTAAYMGLRSGELWAIKRSDVNLLKRELVVDEAIKELPVAQTERLPEGYTRLSPSLVIGPTKTHATRKLSIPSFLADELETFIETVRSDRFLFTDSDGGPVRHTNFYKRVFKPRASIRFHDLRHTCAALLIDQGAHPAAIQRHLGHEDIRTTLNTYGSLFPAAQEAMAAGMDAGYRAADTPSDLSDTRRRRRRSSGRP
jgi:integrase